MNLLMNTIGIMSLIIKNVPELATSEKSPFRVHDHNYQLPSFAILRELLGRSWEVSLDRCATSSLAASIGSVVVDC